MQPEPQIRSLLALMRCQGFCACAASDVSSKNGVLHTLFQLIAGQGAIVLPARYDHRHITCLELWTFMGCPVCAAMAGMLDSISIV